jgi:glycosyltransferase involved in cell wall biosynthesis
MRIGFDGRSLESPAGGVRRYARELLQALARINPHDTIVVFAPPAGATLPDEVQRRAVRRFSPTNLGWSLVDLPLSAAREQLDVFHAPAYTAPLHAVHPLVLTIHDVSYERHPEWYPYRRDFARRWFYRRSAMTADVVITDSKFSRQEIVDAYVIDPNRITVVPLGVGAPFISAVDEKGPSDISRPYVLHVGDLHPRRNLPVLIRALARIPSLVANCAVPLVVLVGIDRGDRSKIDEEARRCGVRIHFVGAASDHALASLYAGAAAFAYPSRYEGFGLPLLEAMACGAPVLAARTGAIPEVVGHAAILVDPDDEDGIASGIGRLIIDSDLADGLREAGRQRAKTYTWDRTAALTSEAYRAAADRLLVPHARRTVQ